MFLSQKAIEELTGYKQFAKQRQWLVDNGYSFKVGGDRKIKLLKSHLEETMNPCGKKQRVAEPDFGSLRAG